MPAPGLRPQAQHRRHVGLSTPTYGGLCTGQAPSIRRG
jgi:hypothetical protein